MDPASGSHAARRCFGHDFSRIPIYARTRGQEPEQVPELGTSPEAEPDAGVALQSDSRSATGVRLDYQKLSAVQGGCGDFSWQVKWTLPGATADTNGFIVQKVKQVSIGEKCSGESDDVFNIYWEAWQVKGGRVMSGLRNVESLGDEFSWSNTNGSKGTVYVTGAAKFMPNYLEPFSWKGRQGPLPSTESQPNGWSESGSKYRYAGVSDYSCCDNQFKQGKFTTEELDV